MFNQPMTYHAGTVYQWFLWRLCMQPKWPCRSLTLKGLNRALRLADTMANGNAILLLDTIAVCWWHSGSARVSHHCD